MWVRIYHFLKHSEQCSLLTEPCHFSCNCKSRKGGWRGIKHKLSRWAIEYSWWYKEDKCEWKNKKQMNQVRNQKKYNWNEITNSLLFSV